MRGKKPVIWFFREREPEDSYAKVFEAAGFATRHIPVLRFRFESTWEPLPSVHALILTSRRAAEAVASLPDRDRLLPPNWREIPWYAIGPSSAAAAKEIGAPVDDRPAHTAAELARIILRSDYAHVAFLAGEPHREDLPEMLHRAGVDLETRIVYRTEPALTRSLDDALDGPDGELSWPDCAVFFSPRGVEIVSSVPGPDWKSVCVAAIGPTTADAVMRRRWNLVVTSPKPEPRELARVLCRQLSIPEPETN